MEEEEIQCFYSFESNSSLDGDFPRLQSLFILKKQGSEDQQVIGKLYQKCLILEILTKQGSQIQNENKNFKIEFDFDTIFSILRHNTTENEFKTHSGIPYAIKIDKYQHTIELHSEKAEEIQIWSKCLGKKLNQRNFHTLFKPIKRIGKGTFATVYLVYKYCDAEEYAVKAFSKQIQYTEEKGKEALKNQINIMREFDDKYLMKIQGVYETENSLYMCVQYLRGGALYEKIKKRHIFKREQIHQIMKCLLLGIAAMHEKNIMHRDLKPENIIFRDENSLECVIADFGLATRANAQNYIFTRCGTPGYVAPEISNMKNKSQYSTVCDIFSLGVIFHILLLGKSPFPGKDCDQVLKQNRQCQIDFQKQSYSKLKRESLDLLKRMLKKNPSDRISAKQCLDHEYFHEKIDMIPEQLYTKSIGSSSKRSECQSPLMITKNSKRKRNLRLRDDSCLKFKMKEQIQMNEEYIGDKINSPACIRKKISKHDKKSKTLYPSSNFKV